MKTGPSQLFLATIFLLTMAGKAVAQGPPFAEFLTEDDAWCQRSSNQSTAEILITGEVDTSRFELQVELRGKMETLVNLPSGIFTLFLNNQLGRNEYIIHKVIEYQEFDELENEVSDTLVIEVHPLPDMSLSVDEGDVCSPADMVLRGREGYPEYTWDFGDGNGKTTVTNWVIHTYALEGGDQAVVFPTKLKVTTANGCVDSLSGSVEIFPSPEADFTVTPQLLQYPHATVTLANQTPGNWSFLWDFGDGTGSSARDPGDHVYGTYGVFDITLQAFSSRCADSLGRQIHILPPPPVADFSPDTSGCPPLRVSFRNHSLYAESYAWDFDDGGVSSEIHPTHTFLEPGAYEVRLVATGVSGSAESEQTILVHELPQAAFEPAGTGPGTTTEAFGFLNQSVNAVEYHWDFGDGASSMEESPSHLYTASGDYTVTLIATSAEACLDTLVRESLVSILPGEGETIFPNAFVWNGTGPTGGSWTPGSTDITVFHPKVSGAAEFRMAIFTRLGHKIFETHELYVGWDGYVVTGDLAAPGVYIYKAWITYSGGKKEVITGDVTFLYPQD